MNPEHLTFNTRKGWMKSSVCVNVEDGKLDSVLGDQVTLVHTRVPAKIHEFLLLP